jgi:hypothetical protein
MSSHSTRKAHETRASGVVLRPDDLEVGQYVALYSFKPAPNKPSPFHGQAVRVKAINLPYVVGQPTTDPSHAPVTLDVRFMNLMRVTEEFAMAQAIMTPTPTTEPIPF